MQEADGERKLNQDPSNAGETHVERKERVKLGMRLSQLTPALLAEILKCYQKICGGRITEAPPDLRLTWLLESLERSGVVDWRYGCSLPSFREAEDTNAKLIVRSERAVYDENKKKIDEIIRFSFDPNIIEGEEAERMTSDFRQAAEDLLEKHGVAVDLKK